MYESDGNFTITNCGYLILCMRNIQELQEYIVLL